MKKKNTTNNYQSKTIQYKNEDTDQIKKFIIILVGVALIAGLLYFVTAKYLVKDAFQEDKTSSEVTFDYSKVNVGNIFNRPYDKYYVYAYDASEDETRYYSTILELYKGKTKVFTLDLANENNKKYVSDKSNKSATKVSELALKNPTLMLIENGKITEYYDSIEKIKEILK